MPDRRSGDILAYLKTIDNGRDEVAVAELLMCRKEASVRHPGKGQTMHR